MLIAFNPCSLFLSLRLYQVFNKNTPFIFLHQTPLFKKSQVLYSAEVVVHGSEFCATCLTVQIRKVQWTDLTVHYRHIGCLLTYINSI